MPGVSVNQAGTVKTVTALYANVAGVVKSVLEGWVNQAGTVKKFWPSIGPPTAISDLRVTTSSSNSVTLAWTAAVANGSAVTGYEISYGTDGVNFPTTKTVGVVTTDTVSGLATATAYYFRIRPNSALGYGGYSNIAQGTTTAATIPQAPSVTVQNYGSSSVALQITAGGGGTPTAYEIDRALNTNAGSGPYSWTTIQSNLAYTGSPQTFNDTGLQGAQCYTYRVRAKNGAGTSTNSGQVFANTTGTVSSGTIWCAVDPEDVGTFKDTGYGTNSAASGNAGQAFGTNYGVSVPGTTLARLARSGNTTMTIWLEAASLPSNAFSRISFGDGSSAYSAAVSPPGSAGGTTGTLWQQSWSAPIGAAGSWLDNAFVPVNIA